jgi:hypothetical protein
MAWRSALQLTQLRRLKKLNGAAGVVVAVAIGGGHGECAGRANCVISIWIKRAGGGNLAGLFL